MSLRVSDLHIHYGGAEAVRGITFTVAEGEIVALLGSNGAGKTTTLRVISGLKSATSGEIWLGDQRIDGRPAHRRVGLGIAHVPEGKNLFPHMTVGENLALGAYLRKDKQQVAHELDELLQRFPILSERRRQKAWSLSGGEQQQLAICRALMNKPRVLMLDEPSLGLSPKMVVEISHIVGDLTERGIGVLLVEQNARLALGLSHRGYVLERGAITIEGDSKELLSSAHVRKAYLGI